MRAKINSCVLCANSTKQRKLIIIDKECVPAFQPCFILF